MSKYNIIHNDFIPCHEHVKSDPELACKELNFDIAIMAGIKTESQWETAVNNKVIQYWYRYNLGNEKVIENPFK